MTIPPLNCIETITDAPGVPPGMTKIAFSLGGAPFMFSDALLVHDGEMTPEQIDVEIQRRYDEWLELVTAVNEEPIGE